MTQETEVNNTVDVGVPNLNEIFKRHNAQGTEEPPKKEIKEKEVIKKQVAPQEVSKKEMEVKSKEDSVDNKPAELDWKSEVTKLEVELEKLQRNLKETRKWGDDNKRQLSAYKKGVEKFKEDGNLSEDEASELLNHTKYEELQNKDKSFLEKAAEVWDREIENIRKYSDYPELDKHLHAFQHFIHNGTQEEIEETYEDIKDIIDSNPILFTKKMLEVGKRYHDEIFADLIDAGNLKNFKNKYESKLEESKKREEKLQKEIDKLKSKYEGYDENPNYRMPQGGDSGVSGQESATTRNPGRLIEKFNQGLHQFPR